MRSKALKIFPSQLKKTLKDRLMKSIRGRCMYIWKLAPVIEQELGIKGMLKKAKAAKLSGVWIKIAEGAHPYPNVSGDTGIAFHNLREAFAAAGIDVWGWHIPYCATNADSEKEAALVAKLADDLQLDGVLMDAESEAAFFKGDKKTATAYAKALRKRLNDSERTLGISSHDIPTNFPGFPFDAFAAYAEVNAPQVYYGGSPSVANRLDAAIKANGHLEIDFCPVGAGWIGDSGGCTSGSACAERALAFMNLVRQDGFHGYSFWHWEGAPSKLWQTLFAERV
jgi:hypothetical protein